MSTSAEIGRWPLRSRRCFIQSGVGARASTPRITRPEKRPHRSGASTRTGRRASICGGTGSNKGSLSAAPVIAATSRATPTTLRQSARFGVSLIVSLRSSRSSVARMSWPMGASASRIIRPLWSSDSPSSRAEHSMPCDSTPRIVVRLMRKSPGSTAPSSAHGTRRPAATLGAPHTMLSFAPVPASTSHTVSLSAFGCFATETTWATTIPVNGGATGTDSSTSSPLIVRRCASSSLPIAGFA